MIADSYNERKRAASVSPEKRAAASKAVGTMLDAFFGAIAEDGSVDNGPVCFTVSPDGNGGFAAEASDRVLAELVVNAKVSEETVGSEEPILGSSLPLVIKTVATAGALKK